MCSSDLFPSHDKRDPMTFSDARTSDIPALRWNGKGMQMLIDPSHAATAMVTDQEENDDTRSETLSRISSIRRRMERTL